MKSSYHSNGTVRLQAQLQFGLLSHSKARRTLFPDNNIGIMQDRPSSPSPDDVDNPTEPEGSDNLVQTNQQDLPEMMDISLTD